MITQRDYITRRRQIERVLQYLEDQMNVVVGEVSIEELYSISQAAAIVSDARYKLTMEYHNGF